MSYLRSSILRSRWDFGSPHDAGLQRHKLGILAVLSGVMVATRRKRLLLYSGNAVRLGVLENVSRTNREEKTARLKSKVAKDSVRQELTGLS